VASFFKPEEPELTPVDQRAISRLKWLLDAPLFVDETLVERQFDALVRPDFELQSREIGSTSEEARRRLTGGEAGVGGKIGIPFLTSGGATIKGKHERETGSKNSRSEKFTEVPVNSTGRKLEEIAAYYLSEAPERMIFLDSDGLITTFDEKTLTAHELDALAGEAPRALIFLEVAPETPITPMACELVTGKIHLLYENYAQKVFPTVEQRPIYPSDKESNPETRAKYWHALTEAFQSKAAMEVVECAGDPDDKGSSAKLAWIDFRLPIGDHETLHLHCVPDGRWHTGVFGYNFVRRGYRQGVRIVGTLKAGLDFNVLAIFDR
jgi:hypothetical protein